MVDNAAIDTSGSDGVIGVRTISNQQQIFSILAAVEKSRSPITIKFEGNDRYFTSLILRTELEEGYIIIDEIAPEEGHQLALQKLPFSIRGSHNGVSLFFRPNVIAGSGTESNIAFYKVNFPEEMIYQQRRLAYRATVPRALNVMATTQSRERGEMRGYLHDISISGCRINFEDEVLPEFVRGESFENCEILLNDGYRISCPITLKHATYVRDWNETTCGFQFECLDKTSQKAIDRFVYFLQREARRMETR